MSATEKHGSPFARLTAAFSGFGVVAAGIAASMATFAHALARSEAHSTLNDLQATVEAAGIAPSYHVNPEQDIWRQMDQIRLKLVAT